jgi:uncharacterized Zn finger protein
MSWYEFRPYVSVAEKREQAKRELAQLRKRGRSASPVAIAGRAIASSFWGKAWCDNLERYSDYEYRLPRGRSYVRNGAVIDLQITQSAVTALVSGSELYKVKVAIAPLAAARWRAICRDCVGSIDSLVELLQGRFAKGVMDRVCREGDGMFPAPDEIKLSCSCFDWAGMCKHVAAALYGVGARLDESPRLLFVLRGVDETALLAGAATEIALPAASPDAAVLEEKDVAALFGLEMAEPAASSAQQPAKRKLTTGKAQRAPKAKPSSRKLHDASGAAAEKRSPRARSDRAAP